MIKKLTTIIFLLCASMAFSAVTNVSITDLNNTSWTLIAPNLYNINWSDIGASSGWTDPNTANLRAIYYFQETNGTTTYVDSWTNNFDGTPMPSSSAGPTATNLGARVNGGGDEIARVFDGVDDYISLPNLGLSGSNPFSVCLWMKTGTTAVGSKCFIEWGLNSTHNLASFYVNTLTTRSLYFGINGISLYTGTGAWTANVWNHIAFTYSGGALTTSTGKWYVNGVQKTGTLGGSGTPGISDVSYVIGYDQYYSGREFPGELDGVRFYNKALSSNEVYNLYYTNTLHPTNSIEDRLAQ